MLSICSGVCRGGCFALPGHAAIDHHAHAPVWPRQRSRVTTVSSNRPPGLATARRWWPKKRR